MCGLFGLWYLDGSSIEPAALSRAARRLRHRGPDDEGYFLAYPAAKTQAHAGGADSPVALNLPDLQHLRAASYSLGLAFRRLSILDLSPEAHQPMTDADGRFTLILNGEIYNYRELREELAATGTVFRTRSDTEVLLAAWRAWGRDALSKLVGMFAFAVYDRDQRRLTLVRDPFGIKPLYYAEALGRFAFASEIAPLLDLNFVSRRARPQRVYDYLRFGVTDHGGETLLADVRQLPAGTFLDWTLDSPGAVMPQSYYQLDPHRRCDVSFDDAAARIRDLFLDNVRLHLRSDVPVGVCLSGGIDSSAILSAMRYLEPSAEIHAVSYVADDPSIDESRWIDVAAAHARATVHKVRLSPEDLTTDLTHLIESQGEPFGSTSIHAQHAVFRRAAERGIKVMLDGQGADELFAGYRPYLAARAASLLAHGRIGALRRLIRHASRLPGESTGALMQQVAGLLLPETVQSLFRPLAGRPRVPAWLDRRWFAERGVTFELLWRGRGRDVLRCRLHEALTRDSLPMLLRYEDRNSMAHSVESRVPFLTPALVAYVAALPEAHLVSDTGETKSVFRAAMRGLVPDVILNRRDKIGFATPERDWLSRLRPWVRSMLESDALARVPTLRPDVVRRECEDVLAGRARFDFRVWRWINLVAWTRAFEISFAD
jgi:asparagine synthase (glutamine-hydrolysing)